MGMYVVHHLAASQPLHAMDFLSLRFVDGVESGTGSGGSTGQIVGGDPLRAGRSSGWRAGADPGLAGCFWNHPVFRQRMDVQRLLAGGVVGVVDCIVLGGGEPGSTRGRPVPGNRTCSSGDRGFPVVPMVVAGWVRGVDHA